MATVEGGAPLEPGERAPNFTLPAVDREGVVSLADYQGKSAVLLALFRELGCAFCRRHIAHLGAARDRLRASGVEPLAITASPLAQARLYFRFHPAQLSIAADPDMSVYRAYGLPPIEGMDQIVPVIKPMYRSLAAELRLSVGETASMKELAGIVGRQDGFAEAANNWHGDTARAPSVLTGQFLVDRDGIVRWVNIEGAREGLAGLGKFPTDTDLLAAAESLRG